jgi:hypothetical protein
MFRSGLRDRYNLFSVPALLLVPKAQPEISQTRSVWKIAPNAIPSLRDGRINALTRLPEILVFFLKIENLCLRYACHSVVHGCTSIEIRLYETRGASPASPSSNPTATVLLSAVQVTDGSCPHPTILSFMTRWLTISPFERLTARL